MGRLTHVLVTGAKSRSHLLYVAAYLRSLLDAAPVDDAAIEIRVSVVPSSAFLSATDVTLSDVRALLPDDPRLSVEEGMPGWRFAPGARAIYVSVGAPGLRALVNLRRAQPLRAFRVVVTDEGIGTYGSLRTRRDAMSRQGVRAPRAAVKAAVLVASSRLLTSERWPAYRRGDAGWGIDPRVAREFRCHVPDDAVPGMTRDAIILTQPFVDLGLVDEASYVAYVDALAAAASGAGLQPLVRPHPSEDMTRYAHLDVMPLRGTADIDSDVVRAAAVLGGPSTALLNLAAVHGARTVWVSEPSLRFLDTEISRDQAEIFRTFLGFPVTPEGVQELLT